MPVIKEFNPPTWCTVKGAAIKLNRLEQKGLPSFRGWRFITLTLDRKQFSDAEAGYHYVKDRLRYFFRTVRDYLKVDSLRYLWKLEFQEDGWAHWHVILDCGFFDCQDLNRIWGYGRTSIEVIRDRRIPYAFKYICKNTNLPGWFLKLQRPRIFQSSRLFGIQSQTKVESPAYAREQVGDNLGDRLLRWKSTVMVWRDDPDIQGWADLVVLQFASFWEAVDDLIARSFDIFEPGTTNCVYCSESWLYQNTNNK